MRSIFFLSIEHLELKHILGLKLLGLTDNFNPYLTEAFFSPPTFFCPFYSEVDFTGDHWNC